MTITINGTTGIAGVDGSASTPAVQGADTNTGIFFPAADTIAFAEGGVESMRIDSSGNVMIGNTSPSGKLDVRQSTAGGTAIYMSNTNASPGPLIFGGWTNAAPNNTSVQFMLLYDSVGYRMYVQANGGIYNYSGNNSNLSDRREKTDFAPAKNYLETICSIPVQTFKYIDQPEDDQEATLGVVAQDVQQVAPELVTESNWGTKEEPKMRLSVYQTDLQFALMKCIQELKAELDTTKARLAALEAK
jgi:hypothetical protein